MKKIIHCCTNCGAEKITEGNEKAKYRKIVFTIGEFDSDYVGRTSTYDTNGQILNELYLCPKCYKPLGISDENSKYAVIGNENIKLTSEKIYDLFAELINEIISNQ